MPVINGEITQRSIIPDEKYGGEKELRQTFFSTPPKEEWNKTFG